MRQELLNDFGFVEPRGYLSFEKICTSRCYFHFGSEEGAAEGQTQEHQKDQQNPGILRSVIPAEGLRMGSWLSSRKTLRHVRASELTGCSLTRIVSKVSTADLLDEDVSVGQRVRPKGTLVEVGPEELAEVVRRQALRELGLFALRQALQSVKVFPDIIPIYLAAEMHT